jgi:hypothetical protein
VAIKVTLRKPLEETLKDLFDKVSKQQGEIAKAIIAIRPISPRHLLIYPRDEKAKNQLLGTKGWLDSLQADITTRDYTIVVYGVNKALEPEEVIRRLQEQNSPGLFVGSWAKWIGQRPIKTGAIRVALKCPIRANKAIQQGLILDYEILRVRQYIPTKRCQKCKQIGHTRAKCTKNPRPMGKTFYKEKETTVSTTF